MKTVRLSLAVAAAAVALVGCSAATTGGSLPTTVRGQSGADLPPRTLGITVPPGDSVAIVSVAYIELPVPAGGVPPPRSVTVTDPATVASLRATADGLPTAPPGEHRCPVAGTVYKMAFAPAPDVPPDIGFTDVGCGNVDVIVGDSGPVALATDAAFVDACAAVLGLPAS